MIKDKIGHQITVGSYIVYGHALDRSAALRIGKVLSLKTIPGRYGEDSEEYRIGVISVHDDWWYYPGADRTLKLNKKGTLQFPNRILVLHETQVPAEYKELLDSVK